jgi:hypothetical protein
MLNGRQPQFFLNENSLKKKLKTYAPETYKSKTMVVAPLRVT